METDAPIMTTVILTLKENDEWVIKLVYNKITTK